MLGRHMDPLSFMKRIGEELIKVNPAEIQKLSDLIWERYENNRFVFVIGESRRSCAAACCWAGVIRHRRTAANRNWRRR